MSLVAPLQSAGYCAAGKSGPEHLADFQFLQAFTCTFAEPAGLLIVGMLVYGGIGLSIYIRTGSVIIPVILLFLTGGAVVTQVAAPAAAAATVLVLTAGGGVVAYLYYRYSR